jgi:hypothetical protein
MAAALIIGLAPEAIQLVDNLIAAHAALKAASAADPSIPTPAQVLASVEATDAAIEKAAAAEIAADLLPPKS